jgi:hypothetical protein
MSKSYYDTKLNKKILYKEPVFLIKLELKPESKTGGYENNNRMFSDIFNNSDIRTRFMYTVHELFPNAVLLLKQIINKRNINLPQIHTDEEINTNKLIVRLNSLDFIKEHFNKVVEFDDCIYLFTKKQLDITYDTEFIIVKTHNQEGAKFLQIVSELFDMILLSKDELEKAFPKYKIISEYHPVYVPDRNPSYANYYLLQLK